MFYFNIRGDEHLFKVPLYYLDNVCQYFTAIYFDDLLSCDTFVDVYYAMDPFDNIICIQMYLRFEHYTDLEFFVNIDVIDFDNGDVYWRSNCYRFAEDSNQDFVLRLLCCKDFFVSDFLDQHDRYVGFFRNNGLFISKKYIQECLDRPFPL